MPKIGGNKFSRTGDSPKWKSKRRRKKKKKERLNDGNKNGQATHGTRNHASRLGQKRKLLITMASYALQRHLGWRTQSRLGQQWPASLRPPPRVAHASTPGPKQCFFIGSNWVPAVMKEDVLVSQPNVLGRLSIHFFYLLPFSRPLKVFLVQAACVRHPWWRTKVKLAIVFTYFFISFFILFFYVFRFSSTFTSFELS